MNFHDHHPQFRLRPERLSPVIPHRGGRIARSASAVLLVLGLALIWGRNPALAGTPSVQDLVNQFSLTNFQNTLSNTLYTHEGMNRGSAWGDQYLVARASVYAAFQSLGYTPIQDDFSYLRGVEGTVFGRNIVAVKPGYLNPSNEIYIVSGHYDSAGTPGADDDASGVACVLEMARLFKPYHFAKTMVFIAFDAEECIDDFGITQPGSAHYANTHTNDNIKGMVSADMIAHQASGVYSNMAYIEGPVGTEPICNAVKAALETYGEGLLSMKPNEPGDSDHIAFARVGFQACTFTEAEWSNNPNFHKPTDYVDYPGAINWPYASRMCKVLIGYFASQLQIVDAAPAAVSITPASDGSISITFAGLPGCLYATEFTTNLNSANWTIVETNPASSGGTFVTTDAQAGTRASGFYRARFVPSN